jgi:hypothetical protein
MHELLAAVVVLGFVMWFKPRSNQGAAPLPDTTHDDESTTRALRIDETGIKIQPQRTVAQSVARGRKLIIS